MDTRFVKMKGHICISVWVLVFFLEENKHSPPILLKKVQDKLGRTGMEADLKKHDFCMARYEVGGEMHEAFIVSQSGKIWSHLVASMVV